MYLSLIAQGTYFVPSQSTLDMTARSFQTRLVLSDVAVHVLTAFMLSMAVVGVIVHIYHRRERRYLLLQQAPGTIASAAAVISHTDVGEKLNSRQKTEDVIQAFRDQRFRIDRSTGKVVVEGDDGYEHGELLIMGRYSLHAKWFAQLASPIIIGGARGASWACLQPHALLVRQTHLAPLNLRYHNHIVCSLRVAWCLDYSFACFLPVPSSVFRESFITLVRRFIIGLTWHMYMSKRNLTPRSSERQLESMFLPFITTLFDSTRFCTTRAPYLLCLDTSFIPR
jgi:hypothetical protein